MKNESTCTQNSIEGASTKTDNIWHYAHERGIVKASELTGTLPFLKFHNRYKVLDLGCGNGTLLRDIARVFAIEGFGIDIISFRGNGSFFVKSDVQNLPFRDETFDIVYSLGVVEHLASTEKGISEAFRVLRNGGQVLFTVPNTFSLHTFFDRPLRQHLGLWQIGLERSYSLSELQNLMTAAGFKYLKHTFIPWKVEGASVLAKIYMSLDNSLNKIFDSWGFFTAIYGLK